MVRKIPDSVLHHKLNLNAATIARLRKAQELQIETLIRLDGLLSQGKR